MISSIPPIQENRDKFGEVFTPLPLIEEILDHIPPKIWRDPAARWLDPAAGLGQFTSVVYERLMKSLAVDIPSVQERKRHILEKMIFMVELNKESVAKLRILFGKRANIISGDFLVQDFPDMKFDIVLGNPPYQTPKKGAYKGAAGHRTLWDGFVKHSLELLKPGGYLGFITPANWRRPDSALYTLMTRDNVLRYLHIYGKEAGKTMMGIQSRFDVYILERGPDSNLDAKVDENTKNQDPIKDKGVVIIDEKGEEHRDIDIDNWPFLPNFAFDKIRNILVPIGEQRNDRGIPILFSASADDARTLSKRRTEKSRFPVVHNITRRGLGIRWSSKKSPFFGKKKVLLNFNEKQYPVYDAKGEYGMSQLTFAIPVKGEKDADRWISAIHSEWFREILEATKWGAFQTDHRMWKYLDREKILRHSI
jgi:SAM-dependent methyltransferase